MGGRFDSGSWQGTNRRIWASDELFERTFDGEESFDLGDSFEKELPLLVQLSWFDENHPRSGRKVFGEMTSNRRLRRGAAPQHYNLLQLPRTPLCSDGKRPNRFHFVAKKLQPHRLIRIERENIEDAAAAGKLAGQLARINALVSVVDEPGAEFV